MAVSYLLSDQFLGAPALTVTGDTTQRIPLGQTIIAQDATYGQGEFHYVKFTGTVVAGDFVFFDRYNKTCTQTPAAATKGNVGLSMAAQAAGSFGYVMVRGVHDAANVLTGTAIQTNGNYGSAITVGRLTSAATANYFLDGVGTKVSGAANVGTVELYWPVCSGR